MDKKIIILANHFATIYKFRKELVKELVDKGYEVVISLPCNDIEKKKITNLGAKVINTYVDRKSLNPIKDLKLLLDYKKIIKEEKPDVVISYTIKPNVYGGIATGKKVPFIANVTGLGSTYYKGGWVKKVVEILYKIGFRNAKTVIFENEKNAQVLIDEKTVKTSQAVVLKGAGVNLDVFQFSKMPKDDVVKFLFVGRVMAEKGVNELFEAIKKLKGEFHNVEFGFIGWFEEDYSQIMKELEEDNMIKYYGYQDDVIPFVKKAHCIVLPSYHEGMANVLLEAAAMGRAVIASDVNGCKESILDGKSGFICKVKDSEDLYDKLKKFVEMSYEEKVEFGKCGRRYMEDVFDKRKVVEDTLREIEK